MEVFVRAEIPEYFYIDEAAHWIAFGVIPEVHYTDDGKDVRSDIESHFEFFEAITCPTFFPVAPIIRRFVVDADVESFNRDLFHTLGEAEADILNEMASLKDLFERIVFDPADDDRQRAEKRYHREIEELTVKLNSARSISREISILEQRVEIARAKLFSALAQDQIVSRGIYHWREGEEGNEVVNGEFTQIPASSWRMKDVEWSRANLGLNDGSPIFIGVQISFAELIRAFPEPDPVMTVLSVRDYGGCLVSDGVSSLSHYEATSRNPSKNQERLNKIIRTAVINEFSRRIQDGYRPPNRESIIHECIVWVDRIFERKISRTTAQRHLAQLDAQIDRALARK